MDPEQTIGAAPVEAQIKKEALLNESTIGAQSLLLTGERTPTADTITRLENFTSIDATTATRASFHERKVFWDQKKYQGKSFEDKLEIWMNGEDGKGGMNRVLNRYRGKAQEAFFDKLGIHLSQGATAEDVYRIFIKENKGDIGYFIDTVSSSFTPEEIEENRALIQRFGKIYGKNSARVSELFIDGVSNITQNKIAFIEKAKQQLQSGGTIEGGDVVDQMYQYAQMSVIVYTDKENDKDRKQQGETEHAFSNDVVSVGVETVAKNLQETISQQNDFGNLARRLGFGKLEEEPKLQPQENQDTCLAMDKEGVFVVCDGMGGPAGGHIASRTVKERIQQQVEALAPDYERVLSDDELRNLFEIANATILQQVQQDNSLEGMGTTASLVQIWKDKQGVTEASIINIGDSRVYILDEHDELIQITDDHGTLERLPQGDRSLFPNVNLTQYTNFGLFLHEFKDQWNDIFNNATGPDDLPAKMPFAIRRLIFKSYKDNRHFLTKTGFLGANNITPRIYRQALRRGDRVLITSDGIHDNLTSNEIKAILLANRDPLQAAKALREKATQIGSLDKIREDSNDNYSLIEEAMRAQGLPMELMKFIDRAKPDDTTALVIAIK